MPEAPLAALSSPAARSKYVEYARAIALRPTQAGDLYSDLGSALSALGERRAAAAAYMSAIAVAPAHAVAYNNLAALLRSSPAHRGEALRLWLTAHALQPQQYARYPEMHLNVAGVLVDAGRYDEAIWHYERGLRYTAHEGDTLGRLLHLYQRTCDWRALDRLWPRAHHLLLERELPALECSRSGGVSTARRLGVRPALSPMHALTLPLMACELHGLAVAHAAQAEAEVLARNLSFAPHHGAVDWRRPLRVAAGGERRVDPNGGDAGGTMGVARSARGAGADDARTARRRPHAALHVGFLSSDWKRHPVAILMAPTLDAMRSECAQLRISAFALNPVALPRQDTDGMGDGAMTTQSHQGADGRDDGPPKAHAANASRSLRAAFTDDASSRGGGVAPASTDADWEQRVRRAVDTMVPLHGLSDMDAARRVHEARINVLIDLNGLYSRGARPVVLATRPAPLQSTHLGYGASSGARFVDWAIADPIVMPPLTAHGATLRERIVLLPPSHLPSGHAELYPHMIVRAGGAACCARWCEEAGSGGASAGGGRASVGGGGASAGCEVSGRGHTGSRREGGGRCRERGLVRLGLCRSTSAASSAVVYAYFGQHVKLDESTFRVWLTLLLRTPRALLWLLRWPSSEHRLRQEAAAVGISSARLVFTERMPQGSHLCAFALASVALDSPSYASGATGIDVLWSGVPLLAMAGGLRGLRGSGARDTTGGASAAAGGGVSTIFQRNAISLVTAVAQPQMQVHSSAGYVQLGLSLAVEGGG